MIAFPLSVSTTPRHVPIATFFVLWLSTPMTSTYLPEVRMSLVKIEVNQIASFVDFSFTDAHLELAATQKGQLAPRNTEEGRSQDG